MPGCKAPWTVKNAKPGKIRQTMSFTVIRWCSRTACLISLSHSYDEVVARYLRWYAVLTWLCSDRRLQQYCLKSICNNAPVTFQHYLSHSLFDINLFLYLCYVVLSSLNFLRLKIPATALTIILLPFYIHPRSWVSVFDGQIFRRSSCLCRFRLL